MKNLSRQDRNGTRTSEELRRRYQFKDINYTKEEIEKLKLQIITDDHLSTTSKNPVQNRVVTQALNNKVGKETGKGLSSNDFTDTLLNKLNNIDGNAEENVIESISVNGTTQTIKNKKVDLQITDNFTQAYKEQVEANTAARHTHSNKDLLDTYKQTETNLADAVSKKHSHSNKDILDTFTKTQEELLNEVGGESHTHSNKAVLDGITSDDIKTWNNLATYENGGTTDANTTIEPLILTKVNAPTTDFWYIETLFYSSISNTSNRKQIAYSYKFDAPIYTRYCISGTWSEWTTGELKSSSITDYEGHLWFKNGMLLQWGQVAIKPTAADTVTSAEITFTHTYDFAPFITASPQIAYPNVVTSSVGSGTTDGGAKSGMRIYMTRTNTSETVFRWLAIGYKSA